MDRNQFNTSTVQIFLHVEMHLSHTRIIYQQNTPGKFVKWQLQTPLTAAEPGNTRTATLTLICMQTIVFFATETSSLSLAMVAVRIPASLCSFSMLCLISFILFLYCFLVKWGPCIYLIDAVPLLGVSNRSCWLINEKILVWHLKMAAEPFSRQSELLYAECSQSGPLCSSSWMFSVLCTVSPSLLAKAWCKGVFPSERRFQNQWMSIRTGRTITAKNNLLCLSPAFT